MIERELAELVRTAVREAAAALGYQGELPEVEIEVPRQREHGDFATNVALALAPRVGRPPREVARAVVERLPRAPFVVAAEPAGPGFINFRVSNAWLHDALRRIAAEGEGYVRAAPHGRRVQVEFVSANPTGPLHVGHARQTVLGDALCRLLEADGWEVSREYYFNDAGRQMELFAASVEARYLQLLGREAAVPEEGYHGAYLLDIARDILAEHGPSLADLPPGERRERLLAEGTRRVLENIKGTLARFGVRFDTFFSERSLHASGAIRRTVERLRELGYAYEHEGAVFFRATEFGDEKDRVLVRSNGEPTYFAADCAYLVDKFERGFDHLIYVWGADHHGTVKRLKGAAQALGYDPDRVEVVLHQLVAMYRGGELLRMSKRAGTIITLDELLDEVGADAVRFTLLSQSNDTVINFDIEAAKRRSLENPVYYVQYGHARIASILRKAEEAGVELRPIEEVDLSPLEQEAELEVLRAIAALPEEVRRAAALRAPSRLTHFVHDLAGRFHRFYTEHRVLGEAPELTQARLWLCVGTKRAIATVLGLLGVSAPERMEREDG